MDLMRDIHLLMMPNVLFSYLLIICIFITYSHIDFMYTIITIKIFLLLNFINLLKLMIFYSFSIDDQLFSFLIS